MRNLTQPSRELAREQLIVALEVQETNGISSGYAASEAEIDKVIALYDSYDATSGVPSLLLEGQDLQAALRNAIQTGYELTQRGRRLSAIRSAVMQGIELCPVCGISPPRTLDHHLPKSIYHPLAIYIRNLVPLCADCNQSKSGAASTTATEQFIHPYFDKLPDSRFLRAIVSIQNGGLIVDFDIDPETNLPDLLRARLNYQIRRLHLNRRYAQEINIHLASHTTALHMCADSLATAGVRRYLHAQAKVEFQQFHRNHWRPVLLSALGNHDDFCAGGFRDLLPLIADQIPTLITPAGAATAAE